MKKPELTIIIPVFNEKKTLSKLLTRIFSVKLLKQIIIVDDKSTDGTSQIISKYKTKIDKIIFHKKNMGKGAAIKSAQKFIKGKYVIIQDADLEYDPKDYLNLLDKIKKENLEAAVTKQTKINSMHKTAGGRRKQTQQIILMKNKNRRRPSIRRQKGKIDRKTTGGC